MTNVAIWLISLAFLFLIASMCYGNTSGYFDTRANSEGHKPLLYIGNPCMHKLPLNSNSSNIEQNISIKEGQEFPLVINESNPTTGFEWIPVFDRNIINLTSHTFRPSSSLIGSCGTDNFTFKGVSHGTTTLKFQYKRSWEDDISKEKVFLVNVT